MGERSALDVHEPQVYEEMPVILTDKKEVKKMNNNYINNLENTIMDMSNKIDELKEKLYNASTDKDMVKYEDELNTMENQLMEKMIELAYLEKRLAV